MTSDADPPRFGTLDGKLPSELLEDIAALRSVDASPRELERVGVRLRAQFAADSERARRAARPTKRLFSGTLGLALTFAIGAAAGGVVSLGLYLQQRRSEVREPLRPTTTVPTLLTEPPHAAVPATSAESSELTSPAPSAASTASSARHNVSATAHFAHGGGGSAVLPDPHEEVALLARARSALSTDPAEALALTGEHERTFSRGALAQEREVIAIDALLRLGRRAEARARADRFHRLYPESTHGRRVDVLFEIR